MKRYVRSTENITSKIHDEVVMVDINEGNYYGLNSIASEIWDILESPHSIEEVCEKLTKIYDIDNESCVNETRTFVNDMESRNLIKSIE